MFKGYGHYLRARKFWVAIICQLLLIALLYLIFYLNNVQLAADKAIEPLRNELTAIGFSPDALKSRGDCGFPKGRNLQLRVRCRANDIESTIRFDDSLEAVWDGRAIVLVRELEMNGWKKQRGPSVELVNLSSFVSPGKTESLEYNKRVGRTSCAIRFSTDSRFATVSMQFQCLQSRTFIIF